MATSKIHPLPVNVFHAKCFVDIHGKRRIGYVLTNNKKTVWVQIMDGARTSFRIKRHKDKHHVKFTTL